MKFSKENLMLNLRNFYLNNTSAYFKYYKDISQGNFEVLVHDDMDEVIQRFKELNKSDCTQTFMSFVFSAINVLVCVLFTRFELELLELDIIH